MLDQKGFNNIAIIIAVIIIVGVMGYFVIDQQTLSPKPNPSPIPTPAPSTTPSSAQDPSSSNGCEELTSYSAKEYQNGWETTFKEENNLSDSQFNTYIKITDVSLRPQGGACGLTIRYIITKDWLSANRVDDMLLGTSVTISPDDLPLESDPTKPGRIGVSTINLHDTLSFKSEAEALNYFINIYNLKDTNPRIQKQDFQYFWNKESAEKSGYQFAGDGGEPFISIYGTIDSKQNRCYQGELSLISKETTYLESPCMIN